MKLDELLHFLAEERNFDLRGYKPTTLERRIRKRMGQLSLGDFGSYVEHIRANPGETNQLLDTILINVTEFFRDPEAWEIVANDILPPLLKRLRTGHSFRAWVAGCSTGKFGAIAKDSFRWASRSARSTFSGVFPRAKRNPK